MVRVNLELIFLRIHLGKAQAVFNKAFSEASGDKGKSLTILEEDSSIFSELTPDGDRELAAKYVVEGAGHATEGWTTFPVFFFFLKKRSVRPSNPLFLVHF